MKIAVEFIGPMRRPWPERSGPVELGDGALLADLLHALGYSDEEARHLTCSVNGVAARPRVALQEGDKVSVTLLLGGG